MQNSSLEPALGIKTFIPQLNTLAHSIANFVAPGSNGEDSPLVQLLKSVGFTQSQIDAATKQLQSQLSTNVSNLAKDLQSAFGGLINAVFNILITVVVSIYLLDNGAYHTRLHSYS